MKRTCIFISVLIFASASFSQTIELVPPKGSEAFGHAVVVLTNGNYVISDTSYDEGSNQNVGAVFLYNGSTHALISKLTGSRTRDLVGLYITALPNGNFIAHSPYWDNDTIEDAGAFTWINGDTGLTGSIGLGNSMLGGRKGDQVGFGGKEFVISLANGNYVVTT